MIFVWVKPKLGAIFIALSCCVAGIVRFVTALIGIKDFWQDLYLDSATSGCTDIVILLFQMHLLYDAVNLYRYIAGEKEGYQKIGDNDSDYIVEINEETIFNAQNPFNEPTLLSKGEEDEQQFMRAYN